MLRIVVVAAFSLIAACSVFNGTGTPAQQPEPGTIYLGKETVLLRRQELERYTCMNSTMVCEQAAASFVCSCAL
ncbi:MAG TPA: hypothetical protein VFO94_11065 [Gammaproteobacteria bacterium]|nr:hypothetical protein [Gammaproteobacteria bacterium]